MKQVHLNWLCLAFLIAATVLLAGCSTLPQTIPTAVIYDRDLDEFHVEVVEVPEGETPVYMDTLRFRTLIDGELHGGLFPPSTNYEENGRKFVDLWAAPVIIYREDTNDTEWHIERKRVMIAKEQESETFLMYSVHIYNSDSSAYPVYFVHIENVRFVVESISH